MRTPVHDLLCKDANSTALISVARAPCTGYAGFLANAAAAADLPRPVPADRWDIERAYSPDMTSSAMTMYVRCAAFIDGVDRFDAAAFRLPRNEAVALDPQQRLLMQEVGSALAHAATVTGDSVSSFTGAQQARRGGVLPPPTRVLAGFQHKG